MTLVFTLALASCDNTPETPSDSNPSTDNPNNDPNKDPNKDPSGDNPIINDPTKQDPVYDGSDVVVSRIVTNEHGSHIQVDGSDFLFVGAQIRTDAFMNCDKLSYLQIKALFAEASKLGVTCVQIPVEWAKLEVEQDKFDFTYLFNVLSYANEYGLKIELLWFGTNMCGDTHSYTVPDYILRDGKTYPKFDALRTGEYWNYYGIMWFLDFDNENLVARETNAITKMMEYVYEFDSTHGAHKPLIGVQVLNEPDIFARWRINDKNVLSRETGETMTQEEAYAKICNSLNALGKAVKDSKYKVYTRVNLASSTNADSFGNANGIYSGALVKDAPTFATRIQALDGIDIIGDDSYTASIRNIKGITSMFATKIPNNFGHIAENDGDYANTASLMLAAISQHGGYSIYDLLTSPYFCANGTGKVDQGIISYADNSYSSFTYKNHYQQVQNIIKGLKMVDFEVYNVANADFACFNLQTDNARASTSQAINTSNVTLNFATTNGAIGYAIDMGDHIDVYVTADSTLAISNATVSAVKSGSYVNSVFNGTNVDATATITLKANTLYRIDYTGGGGLTSTVWDNIGG